MAIINITALKDLFKKGKQPTEGDFSQFIDACYGNDQELSYDNNTGMLSISSSTSDTTPANSVDLNALKNVTLSYNDSDNKTTITPGNSIEIGPLKKVSGNFYLPTGNIGIGESTSTPLTEKLVINGDVNIKGSASKLIFDEVVFSNVSSDITTATTGINKLPTDNAVKKYVDDRIVVNMFHATSTGVATATNYFNNSTTTPEDVVFPFDKLFYSQLNSNGVRVFSLDDDKVTLPSTGNYLFIVNFVIKKYTIGTTGSISIRIRQTTSGGSITDYIIFDSNNTLLSSSNTDPISCPISAIREVFINTISTSVKLIVTLKNAEIKFTNENSFICKKIPNTGGGTTIPKLYEKKMDNFAGAQA